MDFGLQNAATTKSAAQYIRFNQIFADGDVPQGQSLSAMVGNQAVALQMDVMSRYADGSVKSAILTVAAPAIAASATLQGSLVASSVTAGVAIAKDAALAHGYDLTVNMDISGLGAVTINASQKLAAAVAAGNFEVIRQGALATEISFDVAVTRALRVTFDVVTYADGSVSTKVSFQNDAAMGATGGSILFNSLSIVEGGATRFSTTNLTQYQFQVWAQDVTQDSSAKQTLNVQHDIDYLERTGAIWNYDLTASVGAAPSVPSSWTSVLGVNGLDQYMPDVGGRGDIGPTTAANATWLITQDASAATYALAQDQAAGSIPWHYYDTAKGHYLSVTDYPQLFIDPRAAVQPAQIDDGESGWTTDRAHTPDLSYVAWLLTGDRYDLDMLNAQASWVIANTWNDPRQDELGIVANGVDELRAQAWAMRTIQEAAYANPDGSYEKSYFTQIANNNWAYLRTTTTTLGAAEGEVYGYFPGDYGIANVIPPWQQDYFASTVALGALQGNQDARAVLKWEANFLSGRFLSPDLNPYNGFDYLLNVYDSNGEALTTWAAVATATLAAGNYQTGSSSDNAGTFAELAAMSNADIITVFAGGEDPTDHLVAANAMRAYGWILAAGMPDLRADLQFQIVPRMPDGSQIGVTEMRVVAPTTQNTTVTFTGSNVFAYDKGIGRTTMNGTAGADVLIDNSTNGGDRLAGGAGDDYLIGSTGTNVFAPGNGNDYALIRGGAARFEVSASSAGRLEIQGFRTGTDIIALTGTISLGAILASVLSDGFGGTLLTISPQRTIRLNGVAPSKITGSIFDTSGAQLGDAFLGTPGVDTLIGTLDADTMAGGAGNDTYIVNDPGDVVIELAGGGTDQVLASVGYTLAANVEKLTLTGTSNINMNGNALNNTLIGNSGNNVIDGMAGADVMIGGAGNDTYRVDNAGDSVAEADNAGTDRVFSSVSYTLSQFVENLTLIGTGNINGTGTSLANVLTGNSGDNFLNGKGGADTMKGGAGDDTYYVNNVRDVVSESAGGGTDTIRSSVSYTLPANVENLVLTGTGNIKGTGNSLANVLTGNSGNNILNGKNGADTMKGGAGDDTYYVDNPRDTVIEASGEGTDQVFSSVGYSLSQFVENLTLTGATNINMNGNALNNTLRGNSGNNVIDGMAGADVMTGGGGSDTFGFTTSLVAGNVDTITDFNVANDKIRLTHTIFNAVVGTGTLSAAQFAANASGTAQDANDRIIYETDTGKLFYDSNGSAAGGAVQFAKLSSGLALSNANFFVV
jgi:Ca2+-binding RTX toxin-like protein